MCVPVCRAQHPQDAATAVGLVSPARAQPLLFVGPCTSPEPESPRPLTCRLGHIAPCIHSAFLPGLNTLCVRRCPLWELVPGKKQSPQTASQNRRGFTHGVSRLVTQSAPEASPERGGPASRSSITWLPFFPSPSFTLQLELPPSQTRACTLKEGKTEIHLRHTLPELGFQKKNPNRFT